MGTVHEFRVQRKGEAAEADQELARALRIAVDSRVGSGASFEEREVAALELTNEATRLFLLDDLMAITNGHGEQVEVDGVIYQRHEPGTVRYYTLCGALDIERWTYREVGVRNGPTIVPMELEAGLVEHSTPALGFRIALGYAKDHMRSCEEDMKADRRCPPSRSTLERIAKAIGTEARRAAPRIVPRLRRAEVVPQGAVAISIGLDRTSVPMEEDIPAGEAPSSRRKKRKRAYERMKPEPVNVNYRMAYVGTATFHSADGEELGTRVYTAAGHESPTEQIVGPLMADIGNALRQAPDLAVGVVQDGAPEMWNLLTPAIVAQPLVTKHYEAIDRFHVNERLSEVLECVEPDVAARGGQLSRWNESLDRNDNAIYRIREYVRDKYADAMARDERTLLEHLEPHMTYLENNAHRMRYASLREAGLPVGSGVTEGACKSAIGVRTNSGGQRWRPEGLEAVLMLRSVHRSDRLPRFWAGLSRTYRKQVSQCA